VNGISCDEGAYCVKIDTSIYSLLAVKKAAYKFADRVSVVISPQNGSKIAVLFNCVGDQSAKDLQQIISDFCNELLDQDLREIIRQETNQVRNLILAHAFSRTSLVEQR